MKDAVNNLNIRKIFYWLEAGVKHHISVGQLIWVIKAQGRDLEERQVWESTAYRLSEITRKWVKVNIYFLGCILS